MKRLIPKGAKVAVIGAGASGLCAARILRDVGHFSVIVYEATDKVGGTWNYSTKPSPYSVMYQSLRCNLPNQIMSFINDPFPPSTPSFAHHTTVAKYLHRHAKTFDLEKLIRFNTPVKNISVVDNNNCNNNNNNNPMSYTTRWKVETENDAVIYSAVVVANGHYSKPIIPYLPGQETSCIEIVHSYNYRVPEPYRGKKIIVLGAGASGIDISIDIASVASRVYLSYRGFDSKTVNEKQGVIHVAAIKKLYEKNHVELSDGSCIENVDTILLCTGYAYSFPFLDKKIGVRIRNERIVEPLWNHILYVNAPTLSFVGLVLRVLPWRLFEAQSRLITLFLLGDIDELNRDALLKLYEKEKRVFEESNRPQRYRHMLGVGQWEYRRELVSLTKGIDYPQISEREIYDDTRMARLANPSEYRNREYHVWGPDEGQWSVTIGNSRRRKCSDGEIN